MQNTGDLSLVYPTGANDNRLNARMAELLASSSVGDEEKNLSPLEIPSNESVRLPSRLLHRRIVNMLDSLRKPDEDAPRVSSEPSWKSAPITFGQLRQATLSSPASAERQAVLLVRENDSDLTSRTSTADSRPVDSTSVSEAETPAAFFIHPSTSRLLGEERSPRPPPPSYSFSLVKSHRVTPYAVDFSSNVPPRPPPPRYRSPSSSVDPPNLPKSFDRQFSRLLYGKDRRVKQKRKSYSDPGR